MHMAMDASFPSPQRISRAEALSQLREARTVARGPITLDTVAMPIAVLNEQRQVIFANLAFRDFVGARSVEDLCGDRPGEILGCVNAKGACEDSEACRFCGAAQAIRETQRTRQAAARECHITVSATDRRPAYDLQALTSPFEIGGKPYVLISFSDISHQKRRQALERIFFHDILNTASSFKVYVDLLRRGTADEGSLGLISRLSTICDTLMEEIKGQKVVLSAENGTLQCQRNLIESKSLATQLMEQIEGLEVAMDRSIRIAPFSESFSFVSDDSLVKRIVGNMLKNALEASPARSVVTVGFGKDADDRAWFKVHNPTPIEPIVQKQIFRRYFSTKGKDRGLGTWGMKLLAEEYLGGSVSFTSTPEEGTIFTLTLPLKPRDF
jgi:signal transduction histidine kinase